MNLKLTLELKHKFITNLCKLLFHIHLQRIMKLGSKIELVQDAQINILADR